MDTNKLIFTTTPQVTLATNLFKNVPVILKYEDTNLIEIIKEANLGFTTQIPIFHSDGTYLAKTNGTRVYATDDGKKAGVIIDKYQDLWVCKMGTKTLFEIHHQQGDSFKVHAELSTPDGYFVKFADSPTPVLLDTSGHTLKINGIAMSFCTFEGCKTGIWLKKDGSTLVGVNQ